MRLLYTLIVLVASLAMAGPYGLATGQTSALVRKPDANAVEVRFADDSVVKMNLQHSSIEVTTRYGKLTVPVEEIRRIEFGLRIPEETAKRIETAINRLGSTDFKQRSSATAELVALRELAYPALQRAARSGDSEVVRRAEEAIKLISEKVPPDRLHIPKHDTVVALDFSIVGQIELPALKARTPYFGDTNLKLAEIRTMRWISQDLESKLAIDAARYGGPQELWLDTGIEVRSGTLMQIAASGNVDLKPQPGEAGMYLATPDGLSAVQRGGRAAAVVNGPGGFAGGRAPAGRAFGSPMSSGALLGRIGEHGRTFVVGSRFEGTAPEEGKLFLRIGPSPFGAESSGSYEVRISTGR